MNYCTIEDAWKSSDHLTEQFSFYKKKTIENFEIQEKVQDTNNTNKQDMNNTNIQEMNNTNIQDMNNKQNKNDYLDSVFICNDFWDHLNKCSSCRNKMRQRFSSNVMEKFENVVIDNKDTILIFLICLFALIFCNLLVSIINK
jgi:hypothetical protein